MGDTRALSRSFLSFNASLDTSASNRQDVDIPLSRTSSNSSNGSSSKPKTRRPSNASSIDRNRRSPTTSRTLDRASDTQVQRLLASGMSVHSSQAAKSLASAARIGEIGLVRALIKVRVPVDAEYHGTTALMAAASGGQLEVVQFLARHRANVDLKGPDGATAVYLASKEGHTNVVEYLLHRKASADVITAKGTALHAAVKGGFTEIVALLLDNWAFTQRRDGAGRRAREYASNPDIARMLDEFDRKTALLNAAATGDLEAIKYLVARGDNLETCGPEDETPLLVAAGGGADRVAIARVLLGAGADRSAALKDGSSALHLAVKAAGASGGAEMVQLLLQEGVDPRSLDTRGNRAQDYANDPHVEAALDRYSMRMKLLFAAEAGNLPQVIQHVTHEAPLDARGRADGATPLLAAVQKGFLDVARFLLEKGADVNAALKAGGSTSLHIASKQNDGEMVELLLLHGADVRLVDASGKQACYYACDDHFVGILGNTTAVGTSATSADGNNQTHDLKEPIVELATTETLVDFYTKDFDRSNPKRIESGEAVQVTGAGAQSTENIDQGLDHLASSIRSDPSAPPSYDSYVRMQTSPVLAPSPMSTLTPIQSPSLTPITIGDEATAVQLGAMSPLALKATSSADTDQLLIAVQLNDLETVKNLLPHEGDIEVRSRRNNFTPLCWASHAGNLGMVQWLVAEGAKMDASTPSGFTPLLLAASEGHTDVVQHLLMKGADPDAHATRSGYTALLQAASKGYADVVRHLIKKRVDLEARSADGSTALHLAASTGHTAVVQMLLAGGADSNAVATRDGSTALHLAAFMNHPSVVWLLLRYGADAKITDDKGLSVLDQAQSEQVRRVLLASKAERDIELTEAWWDQFRLRRPIGSVNVVAGSVV